MEGHDRQPEPSAGSPTVLPAPAPTLPAEGALAAQPSAAPERQAPPARRLPASDQARASSAGAARAKGPALPAPSKPAAPRKLPAFAEGRKVLAVAATSPVKQVAGSIAHTARESEPPVLSAVGPGSVNQAVKAVAIARSYLEAEGIDLVVEVMRDESGGEIKDLILFNLKKVIVRPHPKGVEYQNLKSAGKSGTSQLAGAIAKNLRENKRIKITAVGQNPVFRAVDAIVFARKYLNDDGIDLDFQPEFTHVTFANGTEANAIQLIILSHQV